ncbi:PfaD family polyunsaturated fatty acid/polyketide biosynthesis protein [Burkholderia gladioli]|uniref:BatK n=1 Tax=Burkholderia gladioli (strain BSR3) TaxID=999541 RepID=F2LT82_BURGS|nr:PfaD family polyunsaturated fatty acid/polyketide biosynthesis protein [Burkholderia gladioli]AEA66028.1 BatK [Burkholderia gladioli BSR3]MBW5285061.1 PfaD family polyunsaturated fatty acid/polyketide biosynthesis protein [Burkholderia gladioli]
MSLTANSLGSSIFRGRFGLKYAYVAGGMYRGVASVDLVVRMARAGFIGFFGTGGLSLGTIDAALRSLRSRLSDGEPFGMNLLANHVDAALERRTVDLFLAHGVRCIEAAAFTQITPALVVYRARGLSRRADGGPVCEHRLIAKVSRPEVADAFMRPAPDGMIHELHASGAITAEQADLATRVPVSDVVCVEADSGGHTDGGVASVLLPAITRLRDRISAQHAYPEPICVGLAGGLGTPDAVAAAFVLGADFVLTGSINQCTVESGAHPAVKALLQQMNVQDTDYAPAGDMFEIGAKVQVLKKSVFFPARANRLHAWYSHYEGLHALPDRIRDSIENTWFRKSLDAVWEETREYLTQRGLSDDLARAQRDPKHRMALVFRWYFHYSTAEAMHGGADRVNYQIHTGPALGAFNQWVKHTPLEAWENRHADEIGLKLMNDAAWFLQDRFLALSG